MLCKFTITVPTMKSYSIVAIFVLYALICTISAKKATVKLYAHELENNGLVADIVGGAFSLTGEGGKHWAVVVQFDGDDQVYLNELHRDPTNPGGKGSGGITWISKRMTKEEVQRGKKGASVFNFGTVDITPEELYNKCSQISYNGQDYHLFLRNCQHWVKELLQKLGMSTTWFNVKKFLEKTTGPGWIISKFEKNTL